ncbi:anti-sigma regulatory factor [Streptomyces mashuensis]|uniref:Anti-sigma regulatory factor n=1 Tax=Streptomyces mashuensis TaxID=33904 RepID=A0A919EGP7_9ACTN|nr:SpoIIE family protein phosphatase [Streptomyces mashuensis]GHF73243.1 anti-sigma regulatory factor [Streptomyces mashuensis]
MTPTPGTDGTPGTAYVTEEVRVDHYSAVHTAATRARALAVRHGLPGALPDHAAVLASELASNLAKHARDGAVFLQPLPLGDGLEVLTADSGPGITDPDRCLADGYTTTGTLGAGLGAVRRAATHFALRSHPAGTLACARLAASGTGGTTASDAVGALCLLAHGETDCGDGYALAVTAGARTALVVDGLGHGPAAAEAAQAALRAFHRTADAPLPQLLTALHRALRATRGAAVGAFRLATGGGAEFCGTGNVRLHLLDPTGTRRHLYGEPGVAGWNMPTPRVHHLPTGPHTTAVLHTDGIDARWARTPGPFLLRLPPPLLATALVHGHRRTRDDATVVALGPTAHRTSGRKDR